MSTVGSWQPQSSELHQKPLILFKNKFPASRITEASTAARIITFEMSALMFCKLIRRYHPLTLYHVLSRVCSRSRNGNPLRYFQMGITMLKFKCTSEPQLSRTPNNTLARRAPYESSHKYPTTTIKKTARASIRWLGNKEEEQKAYSSEFRDDLSATARGHGRAYHNAIQQRLAKDSEEQQVEDEFRMNEDDVFFSPKDSQWNEVNKHKPTTLSSPTEPLRLEHVPNIATDENEECYDYFFSSPKKSNYRRRRLEALDAQNNDTPAAPWDLGSTEAIEDVTRYKTSRPKSFFRGTQLRSIQRQYSPKYGPPPQMGSLRPEHTVNTNNPLGQRTENNQGFVPEVQDEQAICDMDGVFLKAIS